MTSSEAVAILEEVKTLDDSMYAFNQTYCDALDIAIEALKSREPRILDIEEGMAGQKLTGKAIAKLKQYAPIVHSRWTTHRTMMHDGEWYCEHCDYEPTVFEGTKYCPACGALMDLEGDGDGNNT